MKNEMTGWQLHQLDHVQSSAPCSIQITISATHPSIFYRLDAVPDAQTTVSKHLTQTEVINRKYKIMSFD